MEITGDAETAMPLQFYKLCKQNKNVSYHKQTARQHLSSTVQKISSHLVLSPCKNWLLFLILCVRMSQVSKMSEDAGAPSLGIGAWLMP